MSRAGILDAIYSRVTSMTVANGFNYTWASIKSDGNGRRVSKDTVLHASFGYEERLDNGGTSQNEYKVAIPVRITGIAFVGTSTIDTIQLVLEQTKAKLADDIRRAYGIAYDALCTAGGNYIEYVSEIDNPIVTDEEERKDNYEVEVTLEFEVHFYHQNYLG